MKYFSLNDKKHIVSFTEATLLGQAPDGGLYFPCEIPQLQKSFLNTIETLTDEEIAYKVMQPFAGEDLPEETLYKICSETISFPIPLVQVRDNIFSLELFHGPTLAFKDIGARFMSRCFSYFVKKRSQKIVVLVATSGDTGSAVANGFYEVEGVDVVILYPSGKVSHVQEKQLTTFGKNIHAIEVKGNFDACQQLVKTAFRDLDFKDKFLLTSANSINIARWLPQQLYYFIAWKQWKEKNNPPVISVPSGNFGNICAGMMAKKTGLPLGHFIAACNANDVVPQFMQTEKYTPKPAVATISNAMDVGNPSNFVRIQQLFLNNFKELENEFSSTSVSDTITKEVIKNVYLQNNYLLDPHGAVAFHAIENYLQKNKNKKGIFLETAHPVKFVDVVEEVIENKIAIPSSINTTLELQKQAIEMEPLYNSLKEILMNI